MRRTVVVAMMLSGFLTGCHKWSGADRSGGHGQGRFFGIGVYDTGRLWSQMARKDALSDSAAATLADDEHVIVVVDSRTGEVRQCGDHSGVCVTTSPWGAGSPTLPVKLEKHAADLDAEAAEETKSAQPATATISVTNASSSKEGGAHQTNGKVEPGQ